MPAVLHPARFEDIAGWAADDHRAALSAFRACARHLKSSQKPYRTGSLGIEATDFIPAIAALDHLPDELDTSRRFFEQHFRPCRIGNQNSGFLTGYYEPEVEVSRIPDAQFRFPFLKRPPELRQLEAGEAPSLQAAGITWAKQDPEGLKEFADRGSIERGALSERDLEIAWARSRVDVFFTHIQGSARLVFPDGTVTRITFDGKSGHPFKAIGRVLIDLGEIDAISVTMDTIRQWLAKNPERLDEILWQNRSFIFFREEPEIDPARGPIGAAKVPLTAGRSIAVDREIHTFGTPFFINAESLTHVSGTTPFCRLMIGQDTGSAIISPARADIFTGSGSDAGSEAGSIKHAATFHILVPRPAATRLGL
jgi:membrane-bound lytic murein transglycosylase A